STFHVACVLLQGFALPEKDALCLLSEWNRACEPPWSERELLHKIRSARNCRSKRPSGYLLGGDSEFRNPLPARARTPREECRHSKPNRGGFGPGTAEQLKSLAEARPFSREGLEWAQERGVLVFGRWNGNECYGVTDKSAKVLELRRIDGE